MERSPGGRHGPEPGPEAKSLVDTGRGLLLETTGRRTGRPAVAALAFARDPDGSLLVAAGAASAHWVANLLADPRCRATILGTSAAYEAQELEGAERSRAIRELILRGGTPAERLGAGPAFRLRPRSDAADD
ncbi:MAG TPA: nitroreductase family deazaflavin-dependent oxidoreductase [Candidatus Limnocylindrales bacterium]